MAKDPKQVAEKWVRRTQAATQDMINGVNNVTKNPAEQAIAKEQKLVTNWNNSIQSGKWKRGMQTVSLDSWKQSMIQKGAPRVSAGVQTAQSKQEAFYSELLPYQDAMQSKLSTMPDITLEDSINKAVEWMRGMAKFRRRGS